MAVANLSIFSIDLFSELLSNEEGLMGEEQFMRDVMSITGELPTDLFDSLAHHLAVCGVERKNCKLMELRRYVRTVSIKLMYFDISIMHYLDLKCNAILQ